jgi:hypothetical protein
MKSRYRADARRWYPALGGVLLPLLVAGCGPAVGDVSGTVSFKGEPLGSGLVVFHGQKATVPANIAADGTFTASKVPVGPVKVTVETIAPQSGKSGGEGGKVSGVGMSATGAPTTPAGKYVKIPDKYKDPNNSGLTYEVKSGSQQHNIELTP